MISENNTDSENISETKQNKNKKQDLYDMYDMYDEVLKADDVSIM